MIASRVPPLIPRMSRALDQAVRCLRSKSRGVRKKVAMPRLMAADRPFPRQRKGCWERVVATLVRQM